jgi:serine/threonine-protein kinase HipA
MHEQCSLDLFGTEQMPILPFTASELESLALQMIKGHGAVTGVQPKMSLHLESASPSRKRRRGRLHLAGLKGEYIFKPPTTAYSWLPEVEDLTMHLAELSEISVVPHSLVRMRSGELGYITKRVDRTVDGPRHMEDMAQATGKLSEQKYHGSHEQIAAALRAHSAQPGLDVVNFAEITVFSFLVGNADLHLKNVSLLESPSGPLVLSPAYDLVATALVNTDDLEELALALNGKRRGLTKKDFATAFATFGLTSKQTANVIEALLEDIPQWVDLIQHSFVPGHLQEHLIELINERASRIS